MNCKYSQSTKWAFANKTNEWSVTESIIYVEIDVHKNNYTFENNKNFATATIDAFIKNIWNIWEMMTENTKYFSMIKLRSRFWGYRKGLLEQKSVQLSATKPSDTKVIYFEILSPCPQKNLTSLYIIEVFFLCQSKLLSFKRKPNGFWIWW